MALTYDQAVARLATMPVGLSGDDAIGWLRQLVTDTDVSVPDGRTVVLFSGMVDADHWSAQRTAGARATAVA
jgi:hypothetical protein